MNWLLSLLLAVICEGLILIVTDLASYIDNIFLRMYEINKNLGFDKLYAYTRGIALMIVSAYAIKLLVDVYVLHTEGDPDSDPLEMLTRVFKAVAMMICGQFIVEKFIAFAGQFAFEITTYVQFMWDDEISIAETLKGFLLANVLGLGYLIIIVAIIIGLLLFIFKAAKRGAELILLNVMLPILALDILTTSRERWNTFVQEATVTIFGYVLQLLSFSVFISLFKMSTSTGNLEGLVACLAWLMLVFSAPKLLQRYVHRSGVGDAAKGMARSGAMIIPNLIRK